MNLEDYLVLGDDDLEQCSSKMIWNKSRVLFVVDVSLRLLGSLSEGDLLRAFRSGAISRYSVASEWMNREPFFVLENEEHPTNKSVFLNRGHVAYPICTREGVVIGVRTLKAELEEKSK